LSSQKKAEFERIFAEKQLYEDWMLSIMIITIDSHKLLAALRGKIAQLDEKLLIAI